MVRDLYKTPNPGQSWDMQSPKEIATALLYVIQSSVSELCSGASRVKGGRGGSCTHTRGEGGVFHMPVISVLQSTAWTVGCCVPEV